MRRIKYSQRFIEDFEFYCKNRHPFIFCGVEVCIEPMDVMGVTAREAFFRLDTHGVKVPCREPQLLRELIRCKKSINWHIKQWVEGFADVGEPVSFYLDSLIDPPSWVEEAIRGQLCKQYRGA